MLLKKTYLSKMLQDSDCTNTTTGRIVSIVASQGIVESNNAVHDARSATSDKRLLPALPLLPCCSVNANWGPMVVGLASTLLVFTGHGHEGDDKGPPNTDLSLDVRSWGCYVVAVARVNECPKQPRTRCSTTSSICSIDVRK